MIENKCLYPYALKSKYDLVYPKLIKNKILD